VGRREPVFVHYNTTRPSLLVPLASRKVSNRVWHYCGVSASCSSSSPMMQIKWQQLCLAGCNAGSGGLDDGTVLIVPSAIIK
jgi:hypothetical protein